MLAGRGIVTVTNPEAVDLFADYRVPQVLNDMGLITYPKELQKKLQAGDLLQEGEELESEIRIATLATGRVLRAALKKLGHVTDCMRLDFFFWMKSKELVEPLPFHKCFTIKY
jgi:sorbitol-specific phosphotransferase system component IIA